VTTVTGCQYVEKASIESQENINKKNNFQPNSEAKIKTEDICIDLICRKTQMLWHGRPYGCGSWLPEDKKDNMWHGRGKYCDLWPPTFPRSLNF